jgi:hypothetical protein
MNNMKGFDIEGNRIIVTQFFDPHFFSVQQGIETAPEKEQEQTQTQEPQQADNEGFVIKNFRIASEVILYNYGIPFDYTRPGVLEAALKVFPPTISLYKDHVESVDFLIGKVANFRYSKEGVPGIDATFYVDAIAEPKIARHVKTGAANRDSVNWLCEFEQSHPKLTRGQFLDMLGETIDGELVRFIISRIVQLYEISLVWHGADPTAMSQAKNKFSIKEVKMDELLQFIKNEFGKECVTVTQAQEFLKQFRKERTDLEGQVKTLEQKVTELTGSREKLSQAETTLRNDIKGTIKICEGSSDIFDAALAAMGFDALRTEQTKWQTRLNEKIPMVCKHCGSKEVSRRSSVEIPPEAAAQPVKEKLQKIPY